MISTADEPEADALYVHIAPKGAFGRFHGFGGIRKSRTMTEAVGRALR